MFIVDEKIHSIQRCELPSVIITTPTDYLLGGCIYNLDCLTIGVIPILVFLVCGYDKNQELKKN
jgi:hypothetical protein